MKKKSALLEEVKDLAKVQERPEGLALDEDLRAEIASIKESTALDLARSGARHVAILEALGVPQDLEGAALEQWCASELQRLRVQALAVQRYLIQHGTKAEAARASEKILEITEREKGVPASAPIIIINGVGGAVAAPWKSVTVVEGEARNVPDKAKVDDVATLQARPGKREG